ncbi:BQ2448_2072 [Microbotryum intermedium]|uniref:BQ2448_2072 protein n=1 Tax=Microbotryum intermedium TaxID=269621 RepID=A0A238F560_9BASI|nr:BQ2448_2072 [Microbotryum intermedium]
MQGVYSSPAHLVSSLPPTSKRSRSSSPGGSARSAKVSTTKRKSSIAHTTELMPLCYIHSYKKPALWTTHPHLLNAGPSSEADRSGAIWLSHASTSPTDWVSKTQSLYLATPPAETSEPISFDEPAHHHHSAVLVDERRRVEEGDDDEEPFEADENEHNDGMSVDNDHEMMSTESMHDHSPTPHPQGHYATASPHQAPPLYDHLAGSPFASTSSSFAMLDPMSGASMSRSASSSSSDHSSSSYSTFDSNRMQRQPMAYQMDTAPDSGHMNSPHHHPTPATSMNTSKRAGSAANGWKVSMGYRSDCEKCVMRVPGHYLHCHDGR